MNEAIGQLLAALGPTIALFIPWVLGRYRDRTSHEKEKEELRTSVRYWQGFARESLDLASNYRTVLNLVLAKRMKEKETVDLFADARVAELEVDFDRLWKEYRSAGPNSQPGKDEKK